MKIILPGGSGQVGTMLAKALHARGDQVVVLSRHPQPAPWRTVAWDGSFPGAWTSEIDGADAVIHLSGRTVNCRYTPQHRKEILESRTLTNAGSRTSDRRRSPATQSLAQRVHSHSLSPRAGCAAGRIHRRTRR